jgi:hypothetical protein
VILQLLGKGQCRAHQSGNPLAERIVEALNVIGETGFLRDRFVAICGDDTFVDYIERVAEFVCNKIKGLCGSKTEILICFAKRARMC